MLAVTARPKVLVCAGLKRSCENGMWNSADQPSDRANGDVPDRVPAVVAASVIEPVAIDLTPDD